jgi:hypothetical protein
MYDTFLVGVYPGLTDGMIDYMSNKILKAQTTQNYPKRSLT